MPRDRQTDAQIDRQTERARVEALAYRDVKLKGKHHLVVQAYDIYYCYCFMLNITVLAKIYDLQLT